MPTVHPKQRSHPAVPIRRLRDAARDGQIVTVRCNLCRHTVNFLARDLVKILDPDRPAFAPPFPCSKCRSTEFLDVRTLTPSPADYGNLSVRRPGRVKTVQLWRTVKLGDQ